MKRAKKKPPVIALFALFTCLVTATACHEEFFDEFCQGELSFIEAIVCTLVCPDCEQKPGGGVMMGGGMMMMGGMMMDGPDCGPGGFPNESACEEQGPLCVGFCFLQTDDDCWRCFPE